MPEKNTIINITENASDYTVFESIYRLYFSRLKAYACKFVSEKEAEDIVHDTYIYVWQKRESIEYGERFFYYMIRAVHNGCINCINRHLREDEYNVDYRLRLLKSEFYTNELESVSRKLYDDELRQAINNAVNSLPQRCQEIFRLSYYNDLKAKEVAEVFNISVRTVEAQIYKALKILRGKLKQFYEEY